MRSKNQSELVCQLANFLGTGKNPHLKLKLSANGPKWDSYTIDYGHEGNVPWSDSSESNWSSWNVIDENNNYYGTITLKSDGKKIAWAGYTANENGYYLDGIHLNFNASVNAFALCVDKIHRPTNANGPFPEAPKATPATFEDTNKQIHLRVKGNQIVDDFGRPVVLKGVVRPSLEWNKQGQFLSPQDIQNMAKWSSNVIRLDLNQQFWFDSESVDVKGSYKQIIDAIIYYATQNQMAVILDLHWTEGDFQSPMADRRSLNFWQEVATAYGSFGTVMFELFNEPFSVSQEIWKNGDATYAGYQEMVNAVRKTGAKNLVIVAGLDYGFNLSFVSEKFGIEDENLIYCSHPYDEKGTASYPVNAGGNFDHCFKGIIGKYPLIFTEFGANEAKYYDKNAGYKAIYQRILDYVSKNIIHYTGFAWWVQSDKPQFPTLIADWNGEPLNGGELVHTDLQQNPGSKFFKAPPFYNSLYNKPMVPHGYQIDNNHVDHSSHKQETPRIKQTIIETLLSFQDAFKSVKQAPQRKEVVAICIDAILNERNCVSGTNEKIIKIIKSKRDETQRAHESQFSLLRKLGLWRTKSRTVEAFDDLIKKLSL